MLFTRLNRVVALSLIITSLPLHAQNLVDNGTFDFDADETARKEHCTTGHSPFFILDSGFVNWYHWSLGAHHTIEGCNNVAGLSGSGVIQGNVSPCDTASVYLLEFDYYIRKLSTRKVGLTVSFNDRLIVYDTLFFYYRYLMTKPELVSPLRLSFPLRMPETGSEWLHKRVLMFSDSTLRSIHFELGSLAQRSEGDQLYLDNVRLTPLKPAELLTILEAVACRQHHPDNDKKAVYVINEADQTLLPGARNKNRPDKSILLQHDAVKISGLPPLLDLDKNINLHIHDPAP